EWISTCAAACARQLPFVAAVERTMSNAIASFFAAPRAAEPTNTAAPTHASNARPNSFQCRFTRLLLAARPGRTRPMTAAARLTTGARDLPMVVRDIAPPSLADYGPHGGLRPRPSIPDRKSAVFSGALLSFRSSASTAG